MRDCENDNLTCFSVLVVAFFCFVVAPVTTFGHAATRTVECGRYGVVRPCGYVDKVFIGALAGVFWPFYWSWELWKDDAK